MGIITLSIIKVASTGISVEAIFMMDSFFLIAQSVSTRLPAFVRPEEESLSGVTLIILCLVAR